jgi:predicted nucleic acid-binding protein
VNIVYIDTSALVKYYIAEIGSDWIRTLLEDPTSSAFTSLLTNVEAACAFARRRRENMLSLDDHDQLLAVFQHDFMYHYNVLGVESVVIDKAKQLANQHPLRAYDAVHLATSCLLNEELLRTNNSRITFVCSDEQLNGIARAEGLVVENPNSHP